jgi:hypothetical protein
LVEYPQVLVEQEADPEMVKALESLVEFQELKVAEPVVQQ